MLRPQIIIEFQQLTVLKTGKFSGVPRTGKFTMKFVESCLINSTWKNLTDTCKLKFPKAIYWVDGNGNKFSLDGKTINGNGTSTNTNQAPPLIVRGDAVTVTMFYKYYDINRVEKTTPKQVTFKGFVAKVVNRIPLEIDCEDNMYVLKQIQAPNKAWPGSSNTIENIIQELIDLVPGKPFTLNQTGFSSNYNVTTNAGDFRSNNETIAQVLERIRKDYRVECWFRDNDLRASGIVYYPQDKFKNANGDFNTFHFQKNILEGDHLEYTRVDDVQIGAKCYSVNIVNQVGTTKTGKVKTAQKRLETFVGNPNGEIRTLYFANITSIDELKKQAQQRLNRFFFEGYKGKFNTIGDPYVKHGDVINIQDGVIQERDGQYFVKGVEIKFDYDGYFQEIDLDMRYDVLSEGDINLGI
jgi:hypothetical protein